MSQAKSQAGPQAAPNAGPIVKLPEAVEVVNIGLPLFEQAIRDQGASVVGVDWRIPAGGNVDAVAALGRLLGPKAEAIDEANAEVVARLNNGVPTLRGIETAANVVPDLSDRTILHCIL